MKSSEQWGLELLEIRHEYLDERSWGMYFIVLGLILMNANKLDWIFFSGVGTWLFGVFIWSKAAWAYGRKTKLWKEAAKKYLSDLRELEKAAH